MIEQFLQNKLSALLDQFIEFQKLKIDTNEGMSIKNSKVKPKLVEQLSQILNMPLDHISGSVQSLSLNIPWKKLFSFSSTQIKITMQDLKLKSKLRNGLSEKYVIKRRERQIESMTQKLFNPLDTQNRNISFINAKFREYLLRTIVLEVKDITIGIQIDLKNKVELVLKAQSLVLRREHRKGGEGSKLQLKMQGVGLYYSSAGDREVELVSPANISFNRVKTEGKPEGKRVSVHNINIDIIHVHLNNKNYGDIARVILLIQWHNGFMNLPYHAWRAKPVVLAESKPSTKLVYCVNLIRQNIADNHFRNQLKIRRKYINLYSRLLTTSNLSPLDKEELKELQKTMPTWKIVSYRSFTIVVTKSKIEAERCKKESEKVQQIQRDNFDKMKNMMSGFWFTKWFNTQNNSKQLQKQFLDKIASIESVPNEVESIYNIKIQAITIAISIITHFGVQPFISLMGYHCEFNYKKLLMQKKWERLLQFRKCKILFDKKLGHHERYKNMLCESMDHFDESFMAQKDQEQDEFEDINYFLEMQYNNESKVVNINLLPFDLYINHQVIQKLMILLNVQKLSKLSKMDKIQEAYLHQCDPWVIVEEQKEDVIKLKKSLSLSERDGMSPLKRSIEDFKGLTPEKDRPQEQEKTKKIEREICLKSAANIIVMANLRQYPETELVLQIGSFELILAANQKTILLEKVSLKSKFFLKPKEEDQTVYLSLLNLNNQIQIFNIITRFNIKINIKTHLSFDETFIEVSQIHIDIPPIECLCNLIQLLFMHIPKHKQNRVRQYIRRKQSIGEQFMDACQNLNEHITKSMVMSSQKMTTRTVIRQRKTKITSIKLQGIVIQAKYTQVSLNQFCLSFKQLGYESKMFDSYNEKSIKIVVKNLKQTINSIRKIQHQIKIEITKKGFNQGSKQKSQNKFSNVEFAHMNVDIRVILKDKKGGVEWKLQLGDVNYQENEEASARRVQTQFKLSYDETVQSKQKKEERIKIPLIQQCQIDLQQTYKFNLNDFWIGADSVAINIKPSLFKMLALLVKELHIDETAKYTLTNGLINSIQVKIPPKNFYIDRKHNQKCPILNPFCQIALFKRKFQLNFAQNSKQQIPRHFVQCTKIGENNFLINKEVAPNEYILQSNIRIVNHQDRTLWVKLGQHQSIIRQGKKGINFSSHFMHKPFSVDLTKQISSHNFERYSLGLDRSQNLETIQKRGIARGKSIPVKPKEMLHLLIDEEEHKYLQIMDQGVTFTGVNFIDLFGSRQILVRNEDNDDNEYLVIRSEISKTQGIQGSIFTFHIYSPIFIANHTPWVLQYRISSEEVPPVENEDFKKSLRRRSFEVVPLKKIAHFVHKKSEGGITTRYKA